MPKIARPISQLTGIAVAGVRKYNMALIIAQLLVVCDAQLDTGIRVGGCNKFQRPNTVQSGVAAVFSG